MPVRAKIKVTAPAQGDITVTVYKQNGSTEANAFTTQAGSTAVTWPLAISAGASSTMWVQEGPHVVSITDGTTEFATGYGQTWAGEVSNDGVDLRPQAVAGTFGATGSGLGDLLAENNLSDLDDAAEARTNLGLGTAAVLAAADVFAQGQTINAQTGTTYSLVAGDAGKLVTLSNGSAVTLTVPQDSDATIAVGTYVELFQLGAGQVTVVAGSGATLRVGGLTAKARAQYSSFGVQKIAANTWRLYGDLAAS